MINVSSERDDFELIALSLPLRRFRWGVIRYVLAMGLLWGLAWGLVAWLTQGWFSVSPGVMGGVLGGSIVFVPLFLTIRERRRANSVVDEIMSVANDLPVQKLVRQFWDEHAINPDINSRTLARVLVRRGNRSVIVHCCPDDRIQADSRIIVPFEPTPLDETHPAFGALASGLQDSTSPVTVGRHSCAGAADDSSASRLRRLMSLSGGWWLYAVFSVMWVTSLIESFHSKRVTLRFVLFSAALLATIFGLGGRGAWRMHQQWLLIPGGVAIRKACRRGGGEWAVHLFDRRRSVLVIHQDTKRTWAACVASAESDEWAQMTPAEGRLLLLAWLSPLTPPTLEKLSDLV